MRKFMNLNINLEMNYAEFVMPKLIMLRLKWENYFFVLIFSLIIVQNWYREYNVRYLFTF